MRHSPGEHPGTVALFTDLWAQLVALRAENDGLRIQLGLPPDLRRLAVAGMTPCKRCGRPFEQSTKPGRPAKFCTQCRRPSRRRNDGEG